MYDVPEWCTFTGEDNMPSSEEFMEMENRYGAHNYKPITVVINRA